MRSLAIIYGLLFFNLMSASADTVAGFYTVKQIEGRWYLIDPQGNRFFSTGVTTVKMDQDIIRGTSISPYRDNCEAKYGSVEAWRKAVAARLLGWGFNTIGAWSDNAISQVDVDGKHLAYTQILALGGDFVSAKVKVKGGEAWRQGIFPDVFDPDFATFCQARAQSVCTPLKDDPRLIGWFTDNELRWGSDWRGPDELVVVFLNMPVHTPGRDAALQMLCGRYSDIGKFNNVWKTHFASWDEAAQAAKFSTPPDAKRAVAAQNAEVDRATDQAYIADCDAFLALLAERYFQVTRDAIKAADPNHLLIGCRFAYVPPAAVIAAAAKYVDVISANCYEYKPVRVLGIYAAYNKPLLIGEFSFRGKDSGLPNTQGAGPVVETQQRRADEFGYYITTGLAQPNLIGYQWFEHADEPREGRFDGENSNYGLVDITDRPYDLLVQKMTDINQQALTLHEQSVIK